MNHLQLFCLIFAIFCIILIIVAVILHVLNINCVFIFSGYEIKYKNLTRKIHYKKLSFSNTQTLIKQIFKTPNRLFAASSLVANKTYLQTLSKFVDYKINNHKSTFRSRGRLTLIEETSKSCVSTLVSSKSPVVFLRFKQLQCEYNFKQKELKIFKLILAKDLMCFIYQNEMILNDMMKIIKKSKNANCLRFYKNNLHFYSNIYGICKYNQNANTLILKNNIDKNYMVSRFFRELYRIKNNIDIAVNYLLVMFN